MSDTIAKDAPTSGALRDMVYIPGGVFRMGSDRHYPEEAPVHSVAVDGFSIDETPVTNAQYAEFLKATGYRPRHPENFLKHLTEGEPPAGPLIAPRTAWRSSEEL